MDRPTVAILVGHYGPGTGASHGLNDEYSLARRDALMLYAELQRDELVHPVLEPVETPSKAPITRAARWAIDQNAACVVEMHYNSAAIHNLLIAGNEAVAAERHGLLDAMDRALATLPNPHRTPLLRPELLLPKVLATAGIPAVIVEPAFIWEPQITDMVWAAQVAVAVKSGIYRFLNVDKTPDETMR